MPAHSHPHAEDPKRVVVDLGIAAATLAGLVLAFHLAYSWEPGASACPLLRSGAWLLLALGAFHLSGRTLFTAEVPYRGLPMARWATSVSGVFMAGCALVDLFQGLGVPLSPGAFLIFGLVALGASAWADSTLLALVGAEFVDRALAIELAAHFGYLGGFATSAVFFHAAVALLEIPLGWYLARRVRRHLGVGLLFNGCLTLVYALLQLGTHGPALHNAPDQLWIGYVYLALAFVVSVFSARALSRVSEGGIWDLSSRAVILTISSICDRVGIPDQLGFLVGLFAYWALASTGLFEAKDEEPKVEITPEMLQDPAQLQALLARLAEAEPARTRYSEATQGRVVGTFVLGVLGAWALVAGAGLANRKLASPVAFQVRVRSPQVEARLRVVIDEVHLPEDLRRGERVRGWMLPEEVERYKLKFTDLFVARPGEPPPEDLDPSKAWEVGGRFMRYRQWDGRVRTGVLLDPPMGFQLSPALAEARRGQLLVFSQGALGLPFASGLKGGEGEGPEARATSWLTGGRLFFEAVPLNREDSDHAAEGLPEV